MTRPDSYQRQIFRKSCGICKHCLYVNFAGYSCLKGDQYEEQQVSDTSRIVKSINGEPVVKSNSNTICFDKKVNPLMDICDEWEKS